MKTLLLAVIVLLAAACGMSKDQMIKKQIEGKKNKILKIEEQIAVLEKQLSDTANKRNAIAVEVKEIQPEEFRHYIAVFGNVEADKHIRISPEMNGQIRTIHVREGKRVNKGELLVSLNTDAVNSSLAEVRTALELSLTTYEKQKSLWSQGIGSEIQYLQSKTQKEAAEARLSMLEAQIRMSQIRAPFDGVADKIFLKEGDIASPMVPVIEFVNLSKLTIKADISESHIGSIHAGEIAEITFSSLPDVKITTSIVRTSKVINPGSRTFHIELNIVNPGEKIRPNMVSSIKINDFKDPQAYVVPSVVIKNDITGSYLYVAATNEKNELIAVKKYVERGMSYEGNTIVTKGLNQGDNVIIAGYNLVSTGSYLAMK